MDTAAPETWAELDAARARLTTHELYRELSSPDDIRTFMEYHVFAVWDFFSLLKRLQAEVSCVGLPWQPRGLARHARFITEIVLAEECDEVGESGCQSHFELYLKAMDEMSADRSTIDRLMKWLAAGEPVTEALALAEVPGSAAAFVQSTLAVALHGAPHEVAASFCYGREHLLPDVFTPIRVGMSETLAEAPVLCHYLDRHIQLDHDEHGPLAYRLLAALCDGDLARVSEAQVVAVNAIEDRIALWDGILEEIRARRAVAGATPSPAA